MRLFFANPIPVGMESECEYCAADSIEPPAFFTALFNEYAPPGIRVTAAFETPENPNVPHISGACGYIIKIPGAGNFATDIINLKSASVIIASKKSEPEDVADRIVNISVKGDEIYAVLGQGTKNLRADRLAEFIINKFSLPREVDILRKNLYNTDKGGLINLDDYITVKYNTRKWMPE